MAQVYEAAKEPEYEERARVPLPPLHHRSNPACQFSNSDGRVDTPYSDLGLQMFAKDEDINRAYAKELLRINPDPDDPLSLEHKKLELLSDAVSILRNESLRSALDLCMLKANDYREIRAWHVLGFHDEKEVQDDKVTEAYERLMGRWSGYEKRYVTLVEIVYTRARDWMFERNAKARIDSMSPEGNAVTLPATPTL